MNITIIIVEGGGTSSLLLVVSLLLSTEATGLGGGVASAVDHHGDVILIGKMKGGYVEWWVNQPSNNPARVLYVGKG